MAAVLIRATLDAVNGALEMVERHCPLEPAPFQPEVTSPSPTSNNPEPTMCIPSCPVLPGEVVEGPSLPDSFQDQHKTGDVTPTQVMDNDAMSQSTTAAQATPPTKVPEITDLTTQPDQPQQPDHQPDQPVTKRIKRAKVTDQEPKPSGVKNAPRSSRAQKALAPSSAKPARKQSTRNKAVDNLNQAWTTATIKKKLHSVP